MPKPLFAVRLPVYAALILPYVYYLLDWVRFQVD